LQSVQALRVLQWVLTAEQREFMRTAMESQRDPMRRREGKIHAVAWRL
jgi:hypothetical protein